MKVGDIIRRKPEWGDWVKYNPWMHTKKDFEIGVIIRKDARPALVLVHWPTSGPSLEKIQDLKVLNESR